jgi:acyl-CoA synthetase (AMP-forming)/AMP-acid ligase II
MIFYTSGSTGMPKGVKMSNENFISSLNGQIKHIFSYLNKKDFTKNFYHKKKKYYVIDFSKKIKNAISQTVTSENCQKLSEKEISQLLDLKY